MFSRNNAALLISGCLLGQYALAQPLSTQIHETDEGTEREVIVTANRLPQLQQETLTASTVITRQDIEARMPGSLFELLAASPGVQTTRTGSEGAQTSLFLRGSNSDHTLILLDGMKINTASEGFARLEHIPVDQIERIEIVRGPHSSVHGADAIGGVIQIFTSAARVDQGRQDLSAVVSGGFGTENSYQGQASINANVDNTAFGLNYTRRQTDGIRPRNAPTQSAERSAYETDALNLNISHQLPGDHSLQFAWNTADSELDFDGGTTESQHSNARATGHFYISESWHSSLQISHFRDDNKTVGQNDSRSQTRRQAANWQNRLTLSDTAELLLGLDHERDELTYLNENAVQTENRRDNTALFTVYRQSIGPVDTTASLRRDRNEQFGNQTTGRLALGTDITDSVNVWAAYSTAFKAPNLLDLYVDFPAFFFFANPDLKPETAENIEVGASADTLGAQWTLSIFQNDIEDLIASDASFTSLTNVDSVRVRGAEITVATELLGWTADASLTLLDHENRATGEPLLRRPDELLSLGLNRSFNDWRINLNWTVRGRQADIDPVTFGRSEVAGSGVVDLAIAWQLQERLSMQLKIGNLLDKEYQVVDGFNTHGSTALFTTRYQF